MRALLIRPTWAAAVLAAAAAALEVLPCPALGWDAAEHRALAARALAATLADTAVDRALARTSVEGLTSLEEVRRGAPLWRDLDFAGLSAWSARDDREASRYQERGRTVLEQLARVAPADIERAWDSWERGATADSARLWPAPAHAKAAGRNAVSSYLLNHVAALRFARRAGLALGGGSAPGAAPGAEAQAPPGVAAVGRIEDLRRALIVEAVAIGFLADGLSSGHLFVPVHDPLARLHPVNSRRVHDRFASLGAYVIDARGEVWQAFGDHLLDWYPISRLHAEEACTASLREVLAVVLVSAGAEALPPALAANLDSAGPREAAAHVAALLDARAGTEYLVDLRMAGLLRMPTPVSATWSVRAAADSGLPARRRAHVPQVREPGGHDPGLTRHEVMLLPRRAAWPPWLAPDSLTRADPARLVRTDPAVASVRFTQAREEAPSYAGGLLELGFFVPDEPRRARPMALVGVGRAWTDEGPPRRLSADLALLLPRERDGWRALSATLGWTLETPQLPGVAGTIGHALEWVRVEAGLAWGLSRADRGSGGRLAVGIESPALPIGFTNAALAVRAEFNWIEIDRPRRGTSVSVALH